jgi:hypothetical protein
VRGTVVSPAGDEQAVTGRFRITTFTADYYWSETAEVP